ncbi:uncharacterized protein LOC111717473 [Eurytemora carolleeae]|uniref:uncharacterized protein LOC111717473 n=1 Tax=Eurytemora carolleeae TaxID=1294199 RepID=UPI000C7789B5|nr:uncharacterized protein LOC111717473 [Eurytemora carolleeae]|eukprot:XP_023348742.1 uncharacterized protein LOC111717473 [Eurytemora affinis]
MNLKYLILHLCTLHLCTLAPLLQSVIDASTNFFTNQTQGKPLDVIISFCKICVGILSSDLRKKFQKAGTVGLVQRVMVATALLYDYLSDTGLFVKDSPINVKQIVHILQLEAGLGIRRHGSFGSKDQDELTAKLQTVDRTSLKELQVQAKNLLNVLKFSNKHLKDDSTPKSVQSLFAKIM